MIGFSGDETELLHDIRIGIEREALRINRDGSLAMSPHPPALIKPHFTRDFSESQLEIITRPCHSIDEVLIELDALHREAREKIGDELLWPMSTPPTLPPENSIPLANMGYDENGRFFNNYRRGLASRYGRRRQMISGIHINLSAGESLKRHIAQKISGNQSLGERLVDRIYLIASATFMRMLPTIVLLTGSSIYGGTDLHGDGPQVLSFRNGTGGYAGSAYRRFFTLESLDAYTGSIRKALHTESEEYRRIGLLKNGNLLQLNTNIIQSEKEFYAPVRLKRSAAADESQISALTKHGVQYIELRFADIDPFYANGIGPEDLMLAHLVFSHALVNADNAVLSQRENNALRSYLYQSDLAAALPVDSPETIADNPLITQARQQLTEMVPTAELLDRSGAGREYIGLIETFLDQTLHPQKLKALRTSCAFRASGLTWDEFGTETAFAHANITNKAEAYAL